MNSALESNWRSLIDAGLYRDEQTLLRDALRALLKEKPQLRVEVAIHRYRNEDISLARAAHLAGKSFDSMRELLVARGIPLRLGPADQQEALREIEDMQWITANRT